MGRVPCSPWFQINAALLNDKQCVAFGSFLLLSITPNATIGEYKVQHNSVNHWRRVIRRHDVPNQAKSCRRASHNTQATVTLDYDNAILKVEKVCKPIPAQIDTAATNWSKGPSHSRPTSFSPRLDQDLLMGQASRNASGADSALSPRAGTFASRVESPAAMKKPFSLLNSGKGAEMGPCKSSINDLAQIDPAIVASPVRSESSPCQTPSRAEGKILESLLGLNSRQSEASQVIQVSEVARESEVIVPSLGSIRKEETPNGQEALADVDKLFTLSSAHALHAAQDVNNVVAGEITNVQARTEAFQGSLETI